VDQSTPDASPVIARLEAELFALDELPMPVKADEDKNEPKLLELVDEMLVDISCSV
jgi:hypothetical protein